MRMGMPLFRRDKAMKTGTWTSGNKSFRYTLYAPEQQADLLPLVVYLQDNENDSRYQFFTSEENQKKHPSYVLCPECRDWADPDNGQALQRLIFDIRKKHRMDICKTYLAGTGYGAVGVWHMLGGYPRLFAGTVAVGGCGDPYHIRNAVYAPVWAFHSVKDRIIDIRKPSAVLGRKYLAGSQRLIDALRTAGSELAKYTEDDGDPEKLPDRVFSSPEVLDWIYAQDRKKVTWVYMITPDLYRFDDWFMSSCYLIIGKERALLVDTTMTHGDMLSLVKRITSLPVDLAVTHPHLDHMLQAYAFDRVYIDEHTAKEMDKHLRIMKEMLSTTEAGDLLILTDMVPDFIDQAMKVENVISLRDGDVIDLGGGVTVEAKDLGGHTNYDMVFVDRAHKTVFTGDAVGSGYVVGVSYPEGAFRETYEHYRDNLQRFIDYIRPFGECTYFGGHYIQENSCEDPMQEDYLNGQSTYYVPLTFEVIDHMKTLCDKLLAGEFDNEIKEDGSFRVYYGDASLSARRLRR